MNLRVTVILFLLLMVALPTSADRCVVEGNITSSEHRKYLDDTAEALFQQDRLKQRLQSKNINLDAISRKNVAAAFKESSKKCLATAGRAALHFRKCIAREVPKTFSEKTYSSIEDVAREIFRDREAGMAITGLSTGAATFLTMMTSFREDLAGFESGTTLLVFSGMASMGMFTIGAVLGEMLHKPIGMMVGLLNAGVFIGYSLSKQGLAKLGELALPCHTKKYIYQNHGKNFWDNLSLAEEKYIVDQLEDKGIVGIKDLPDGHRRFWLAAFSQGHRLDPAKISTNFGIQQLVDHTLREINEELAALRLQLVYYGPQLDETTTYKIAELEQAAKKLRSQTGRRHRVFFIRSQLTQLNRLIQNRNLLEELLANNERELARVPTLNVEALKQSFERAQPLKRTLKSLQEITTKLCGPA